MHRHPRPRRTAHRFAHRLNPIAAALLVLTGGTAAAQSPAAAPAPAPNLEVKVTAEAIDDGYNTERATSQKLTAPLLDTPKTVNVIPQAVIKDSNSTTLQEALRTTPGITFAAGEGGTPAGDRPFIRGYDATSSLFVDNVRDTGSQSRETFDIESIEIYKGPSGAYQGRGSVGGSINLVTKQAKNEDSLSGSVGLGTDRYKRATVDGNFKFGTDSAIRLNAMGHMADVPGRDDVDTRRWGIAPSVTFGLTSPTKVTLSYYHLQTHDTPDYSIPYSLSANRSKAHPDSPVHVDPDNFYGLKGRDFRNTQADIGTAQVSHDFGNKTKLVNTTRFGTSNNDYLVSNPDDSSGNVANGSVFRSAKSRDSFTRTLTNQTDFIGEATIAGFKNNFISGVEFSRESTSNDPYVVVTGTGGTARICNAGYFRSGDCTSLYDPDPKQAWTGRYYKSNATTRATTDIASAYALDTVEITKQWLLNGGVRFDSYKSRQTTAAYSNNGTGTVTQQTLSPVTGLPVNTVYALGATVPEISIRNDSHFFNWQGGVIYKPVENASVYASYSTASSPSGLSLNDGGENLAVTNANLLPERTKSFELGGKIDLVGGALSITGAVFHAKKDNARVALPDGTNELVGSQKVDGVEVGVAGNLTERWLMFAGYTHLRPILVDNGPLAANAVNNGNQFPQVAKDAFSLWTNYALTADLSVGGGAFYTSKVFGNVANSVYVPQWWCFDAVGVYRVNRHVTMQLNVQNLANRRYFDQAFTTHYAHEAPGRSAVLTANWKY